MTKKRKIVKSEGCRSWATTVDGQDIYGEYQPMTAQQIDELTDRLPVRQIQRRDEKVLGFAG